MNLGDIASIATLVLFVLYFVGRLLTIIMVKPLWNEKIVNKDYTEDVVDTFTFEDSKYGMAITTSSLIRDFRIYEIDFNLKNGRYCKKKLLFEKEILRSGQYLVIDADMPDCIPKLLIEYKTFEYMKVNLLWRDNPKNGVMSECPTVKHTIKSILYFLCR